MYGRSHAVFVGFNFGVGWEQISQTSAVIHPSDGDLPGPERKQMIAKMKYKKLMGALAIAVIAVISVFAYPSITASAAGDTVQDPVGDVKSATESANNVDPGTPDDTARGYLDIKSANVSKKKKNDSYTFSMTLAAPIPSDFSGEVCYTRTGTPGDTTTEIVNPPDPSGCFFAWNWNVDDDDVAQFANKLSPTVRWINGGFQGIVFFDIGPAQVFNTFTVDGDKITATIDASIIETRLYAGDGFLFAAATRNHRIDFGGDPLVGIADVSNIDKFDGGKK